MNNPRIPGTKKTQGARLRNEGVAPARNLQKFASTFRQSFFDAAAVKSNGDMPKGASVLSRCAVYCRALQNSCRVKKGPEIKVLNVLPGISASSLETFMVASRANRS